MIGDVKEIPEIISGRGKWVQRRPGKEWGRWVLGMSLVEIIRKWEKLRSS